MTSFACLNRASKNTFFGLSWKKYSWKFLGELQKKILSKCLHRIFISHDMMYRIKVRAPIFGTILIILMLSLFLSIEVCKNENKVINGSKTLQCMRTTLDNSVRIWQYMYQWHMHAWIHYTIVTHVSCFWSVVVILKDRQSEFCHLIGETISLFCFFLHFNFLPQKAPK